MKALIVYKNDIRAYTLARALLGELRSREIEVGIVDNGGVLANKCPLADMVFVLGGDGTILKTARYYAPMPLVGVNFGKVGFLSCMEPADLIPSLDRILTNQYQLDRRIMINVAIIRNGETLARNVALNDVVIRSLVTHPLNIKLCVDDKPYTMFCGDGVICATPTGSTAYSLSAGGPVIDSSLSAFVITPICPQLIYSRSLVISSDANLDFTFDSRWHVGLSVDGEADLMLTKGDKISVQRSQLAANFVQLKAANVYDKIIRGCQGINKAEYVEDLTSKDGLM